jgi:hypothetical protein
MYVVVKHDGRTKRIHLDGSASDRQVYIKAKKMMGLWGVPGSKEDTGDKVTFYPAFGAYVPMQVIYDEADV